MMADAFHVSTVEMISLTFDTGDEKDWINDVAKHKLFFLSCNLDKYEVERLFFIQFTPTIRYCLLWFDRWRSTTSWWMRKSTGWEFPAQAVHCTSLEAFFRILPGFFEAIFAIKHMPVYVMHYFLFLWAILSRNVTDSKQEVIYAIVAIAATLKLRCIMLFVDGNICLLAMLDS